MKNWDTYEIKFLTDHLHLSTKEIYLKFCDEYGDIRSYDSVQKRVKKIRSLYVEEEEDEEVFYELGNSPIPQVVPNDQRKLAREKSGLWLQSIVDARDELIVEDTPAHLKEVISAKSSLVVLLSDIHIGKANKGFSLEVAHDRILSVPDKIIEINPLADIDEVVVVLAGDLVEGEDIFSTQAHHTSCSTIEQVEVAIDSLWTMIKKFRKLGFPVRVETVPGNHGRMSKTANEKTNWDNVIAYVLQTVAMVENDPEIAINCNYGTFQTFKVKDRIGLAYHHGVKHTGTPAMREKIAGWSARKNFDFMVHGHWHEWHVGNWLGRVVISNGCMCGADDLAEKMAKEDTARQGFFFVTPGQPVHGFSYVEWPF